MLQTLKIQSIRRDCGTQIRAGMTEDAVTEYAEAIRGGVTLPPVTVYRTPEGQHLLVDGFHRLEARSRCGFDAIVVEVINGTERDAILHAVGANARHGVRRSNDDKRRAVETLLRDPEWGAWSDREIARRASVSHTLVSRVRAALSGNVATEAERRYVTKHGSESVMDTTNIGASQGALGGNVTTESGSRRVIGDAYSQAGPSADDYCFDAAPADEGEVFEVEGGGVEADPDGPCDGSRGGLGGNPFAPLALPRVLLGAGLLQEKTRPDARVVAVHLDTERALHLGVPTLDACPDRALALADLADELCVGVNGWWIVCTRPDDDAPTWRESDDAAAIIEAAGLLGVTIHGVLRGLPPNQRTSLLADRLGRKWVSGSLDTAPDPAPAAAPAPTQVQAAAKAGAADTTAIDEVEAAAKLLRQAVNRLRSAVGGDLPEKHARRLEARLSGLEETIAIADGTVAATRASAQASGPARARPGALSLSSYKEEGDQDLERESRARPGAHEAGRAGAREADLVGDLSPEQFEQVETAWLGAATKPRTQLNEAARRELVAVLADYGVDKVLEAVAAVALEAHLNPSAAWIRDRIEGRGPKGAGRVRVRRKAKADPISTDADAWASVAAQTNGPGGWTA